MKHKFPQATLLNLPIRLRRASAHARPLRKVATTTDGPASLRSPAYVHTRQAQRLPVCRRRCRASCFAPATALHVSVKLCVAAL